MNNFASIFEELSKLYEEETTPAAELVEEKVEEGYKEELTEAAEDEFVEDEIPAEEVPAEEPIVEDEPRQLICECGKCGALVIKDEADIVADEESDLVNVDDECEFCEEAAGYKIIGTLLPYESAVEDEESAEEETEEVFTEEDELDESVILAGVASGLILDVVKRIVDKAGSHKKKSKWIDYKKYIIEKTPDNKINIWDMNGEQLFADIPTVEAAKNKIKTLPKPTKKNSVSAEPPADTKVEAEIT